MTAAFNAGSAFRTTPSLVSTVLCEYGGLTRAGVARYLPESGGRPYLDELVADYPRRGGKMMRPALCIATARAFGAEIDVALPAAVSIELLHNALLIHDDIQDGSSERRGRPTLHELHGIPLAINAGDALMLLSLRPLMESLRRFEPELGLRMIDQTTRMARESAEGQALDIGWCRDNVIDIDEAGYLEMVLKKTCWFATIYPCLLGVLIGTRGRVDDRQLEPFVRFGFFLGAAFQIQDDLLNLLDETDRYGKERDGDLYEGKRTLMLIHLLGQATPSERARLREALKCSRKDRSAADVDWMRDLMVHYGSLDRAREIAHGLAGAALHEFSLAFGALSHSRDSRFIEGLATWVFERT
jgi:geranylgeranyl diphosphate synthase type II